ncbi:MAG: NYN domain-containing protein [Candidatus Puniceispirillaceae bacterium]
MTFPQRTALFIDGSNFFATTKLLDIDIDYAKMLAEFAGKGDLIRAYYYTALPDPTETSPIRKLIDYLDYNGFQVVSKQTKEFIDHATGNRRIKGNMDMELALDMLKLAPHIDHAYLFSGDGDFCRLLQEVQDLGVKVTVVSSLKTHPAMVADSLRRKADHFIELEDIAPAITRPRSH